MSLGLWILKTCSLLMFAIVVLAGIAGYKWLNELQSGYYGRLLKDGYIENVVATTLGTMLVVVGGVAVIICFFVAILPMMIQLSDKMQVLKEGNKFYF